MQCFRSFHMAERTFEGCEAIRVMRRGWTVETVVLQQLL